MTTFTYSSTTPNPANDPADDAPVMQINAGSISGIVAVEHVGFGFANGGQHKQVSFNSNNVPALPATIPVLFTDLPSNHGGVPAYPELFFYSGNAAQSSTQYVLTGANGSVLLMGGIILKWGTVGAAVSGTTYNVFSPAFPNNCFGVQITSNIASTIVPVGTNGFNQSGFTFKASVGTGIPITYFAIGN